VHAVGQFEGGFLKIFTMDDGSISLNSPGDAKSEDVNVKKNVVAMNGRKVHEVTPFVGERLSIVAHVRQGYAQIPELIREQLLGMGMRMPSSEAIDYHKSRLYNKAYVMYRC